MKWKHWCHPQLPPWIYSARLRDIKHVYLRLGHSYMPCDHAFGTSEKWIAQYTDICEFETLPGYHFSTTSPSQIVRMRQRDSWTSISLRSMWWCGGHRILQGLSKMPGCLCFALDTRKGISPIWSTPIGHWYLSDMNYSSKIFNPEAGNRTLMHDGPVPLKATKAMTLKAPLSYILLNSSYYVKDLVIQQELAEASCALPVEVGNSDVENEPTDYDD